MFTSVSWHQFTIFISVTTAVYYLYILLRYYRDEVNNFIKGTKYAGIASREKRHTKTISTGDASLQELLEDLKILFQLASKKNYPKEELIVGLQLKLKEYDQFKNTPFEMVVNNFITAESDNQCSIRLSEEDQRAIWMG